MPKQAVRLEVKGIKENVAKLRALQNVSVSQDVARLLGNEGNGFRKLAHQNMVGQNWPHEALENQGFVDARWPQSRRGKTKVSILFGFALGKSMRGAARGYVEWGGGLSERKQKRTPVKVIGMSLLTLFEFGGGRPKKVGTVGEAGPTKHPVEARPAWRPALASYKATARRNIREVMAVLLRRYLPNG